VCVCVCGYLSMLRWFDITYVALLGSAVDCSVSQTQQTLMGNDDSDVKKNSLFDQPTMASPSMFTN